MGKPRMYGMFAPCVPNSRAAGKHGRSAPWKGAHKKPKIPTPQKFAFCDELATDPLRQQKKEAGNE